MAVVTDNLSVYVSAPGVGLLALEQRSARWDPGVRLALGVP